MSRNVPRRRDGSGPFKGGYRGKRGLKGRRKAAGQECPKK